MNQALLGKSLWRIGEDPDGLWRQVLEMKYGLSRNGWDIQVATKNSSAVWKGITSVKNLYMANIKYQIGSGETICFWKDRWVGDRPLDAKFPNLFSCAVDKEARAKAYMTTVGGQVIWCPILRRDLKVLTQAHKLAHP